MRFITILLLICLAIQPSLAKPFDKVIGQVNVAMTQKQSIWPIIEKYFINKPYHTAPVGEAGYDGYRHQPLWHEGYFDCMTFVNTVLAIELSARYEPTKAVKLFQPLWLDLEYSNGNVHFLARRHFISADWLNHLKGNGYLEDITKKIGKKFSKTITATINKPQWFTQLHAAHIPWKRLTSSQKKQWKIMINGLKKQKATLHYIDKKNLNRVKWVETIPNGSILLWITAQPETFIEKIGSPLLVRHMGFFVRSHRQPYFLHASSFHHRIIKESWNKVYQRLLRDDQIAGIAVFKQHIARTAPLTTMPSV